MDDFQHGYEPYWFEGMGPNSGKLVYKTFGELPLKRKLHYLGYCGFVKGLQAVRSPLRRLTGFDLSEYPFRDLPEDPEVVAVTNYGPTREDREAAGLDAEHFLSREEVDEFVENGVIGPFRAISEADALKIYAKLRDQPLANAFTAHFEHPEIGDIFKSRPLAARVATLLGENLKLWRSQVFRVPSGTAGTFLHSENDFKEGDVVPAFVQNVRPPNLGQLTIWLAVHPVARENGALKFVTGTHKYPVASDLRNRVNTLKRAAPWLAANPEFLNEFCMAVLGQDPDRGLISAFPMARATMKALLDRYGRQLEQVGSLKTIEMQPGEFVIFTSSVMHGSWSNDSDHERIAVGARITTRDAELRESPGLMTIPPAWTTTTIEDDTRLRCPIPKVSESEEAINVEFGSCELEFDRKWRGFVNGLNSNRIFTPLEALGWGGIPDRDTMYEYLNALVEQGVITVVYD